MDVFKSQHIFQIQSVNYCTGQHLPNCLALFLIISCYYVTPKFYPSLLNFFSRPLFEVTGIHFEVNVYPILHLISCFKRAEELKFNYHCSCSFFSFLFISQQSSRAEPRQTLCCLPVTFMLLCTSRSLLGKQKSSEDSSCFRYY